MRVLYDRRRRSRRMRRPRIPSSSAAALICSTRARRASSRSSARNGRPRACGESRRSRAGKRWRRCSGWRRCRRSGGPVPLQPGGPGRNGSIRCRRKSRSSSSKSRRARPATWPGRRISCLLPAAEVGGAKVIVGEMPAGPEEQIRHTGGSAPAKSGQRRHRARLGGRRQGRPDRGRHR